MTVFRILLNGVIQAEIGTSLSGVVSSILHCVKSGEIESINLDLGALENVTGEERRNISWPSIPIKLGDVIIIQVVSSDSITNPAFVQISRPDEAKKQKLEFLKVLRSELDEPKE